MELMNEVKAVRDSVAGDVTALRKDVLEELNRLRDTVRKPLPPPPLLGQDSYLICHCPPPPGMPPPRLALFFSFFLFFLLIKFYRLGC